MTAAENNQTSNARKTLRGASYLGENRPSHKGIAQYYALSTPASDFIKILNKSQIV